MKLYGEFQYELSLRESFRHGELRDEWFNKYSILFDDADRRLAANQPTYHFFEWLGAIQIYQDMGWLCLVEKYTCKNHLNKLELLRNIVPNDIFDLLTLNKSGGQPTPDLFVYHPDKSDWFLCEIKGEKDKVRENQLEFFSKIEHLSKKPIQLIKFKSK